MGVAAAGTLVVLAAACGGDDGQSAAQKTEYCDAVTAIETDPGPDIDFATATPEEMTAATKEYAAETFRPMADRLIAAAPESLADEYRTLSGGLTEVEQTGDFEGVFSRPEMREAEEATHEYDLKTCDWEKIDVKAVDYRFEDVPRTIDAGFASFEMENDGNELHEIALLRKNDGVTESFDQLLELPEEEAFEKVTFAGASGPGAPDEEGTYVVADLQAGEYAMVCFLPQGAISMEALESTGEDAPPHFALGMKQEFTVE
jgi:hypothetical protein